MTDDEMAGWQHRLNGCGFEWTVGVVGRGGLRAAIHRVPKTRIRLSD